MAMFSLIARRCSGIPLGPASDLRKTACFALIILFVPPLPWQTEKRRNQIRRLLGQSDVVVVARATAYHPVIDSLKYRRERERETRLSPFMLGVVYYLSVTETVYRKPSPDQREAVPLQSGDPVVVYVPGPLADPREFGKVSLQPGGEYLLFLKKAEVNPDDFRNAVEQVSGAAMMEWRAFPDSRLIYFTPVRDSLATLLVEGAWTNFLVETRAVAQQMQARK